MTCKMIRIVAGLLWVSARLHLEFKVSTSSSTLVSIADGSVGYRVESPYINAYSIIGKRLANHYEGPLEDIPPLFVVDYDRMQHHSAE
ncbi:hypothetical protein WG66_009826 [Moniliophthora roreri]|nr:hypothetical protein WG66_009826 [Moniliophthora roreri]